MSHTAKETWMSLSYAAGGPVMGPFGAIGGSVCK